MRLGDFRKQPQIAASDLVGIWVVNLSVSVPITKNRFFINIVTLKRKMRFGDLSKQLQIVATDLVSIWLGNPSVSIPHNEELIFHK